MKEQKESPKKELNKMEASKLLDIEFKTKVMRMLKELSENFNSMKKDIETIKKKKEPVRNKEYITEMKNNLQGINNGVDEAENQISNLEYNKAKNTEAEQQEKKESKNTRRV